jgi:hypothetical protein
MFWVRLRGNAMFHWLHRTEIDLAPKLEISKNDGWFSLNLLLVNRSDIHIWAEEATVVLAGLDASMQASIATGQATHIIRQPIGPGETLTLSLAQAVYEAAGNPQSTYSCIISATIRLRSGDRWLERVDQQRRLEMRALVPVSLRPLRRNEQPIGETFPKQIGSNP